MDAFIVLPAQTFLRNVECSMDVRQGMLKLQMDIVFPVNIICHSHSWTNLAGWKTSRTKTFRILLCYITESGEGIWL